MNVTNSYSTKAWLCLDEDMLTGGTGVRCDQQCADCRAQEEIERDGVPEED